MVELPKRGTVDLIKETIEKNQERQNRNYIGASSIGDECSRKIWYAYNNYPKKEMGWLVLCAIEDGHRTEALMVDRYRMVEGIELHADDGTGQFGFDYNGEGWLKGHYDGVIKGLSESPNTWHIWECKAKTEEKFKELKKCIDTYGEKEAMKNWDYLYYCQAVLYMHMEKLTRHCMVVAKAGGRDFVQIRTEANPKLAKALIAKAERIRDAKQPPEKIAGKNYYKCKWCEFREVCHDN